MRNSVFVWSMQRRYKRSKWELQSVCKEKTKRLVWDGLQRRSQLKQWVSCLIFASRQGCKHRRWNISIGRIRYQSRTSGDCNRLRTTVSVLASEAVIVLVVMSCVYKWSINRVTNQNPVYSHTQTRDSIFKQPKVASFHHISNSSFTNVLPLDVKCH
jgi:hypothetical protein